VTDARDEVASSAVLRQGQVVAGKYRIERLLGRGGMGEVYEARHTVVGRRFAIKFLRPGLARGADSSARFLREAQAAGALDNEHIAAVVDFDETADGTPFLVMEYLNGESLATTLRREGVLPLRRVISILLQACDGLAAAHAAGIVHRDLKPDNLFLVERANAPELLKIVDFGVAKLVTSEPTASDTQSGAVLGTPLYMAPEQARGEKSVDFRVDVHALGVIAYELLSGQRPHPGDGYNAILAHILTRRPRPLGELCRDLPAALQSTVERAMAFEPSTRHDSAAALARELLPFAGRELTPRGAQFDLRPAHRARPSAVTLDSPASTQAHAEGTLQSAVGEARTKSSATIKPGRALWLWGVPVALGASFWLLSRGRAPQSDAALGDDAARRAPAMSASVPDVPPLLGSALPAPASAAAASISSPPPPVDAKARPPATTAKLVSGPSSSKRTGPPSNGREVTFDEKNPY
jgi:serine/threonine protein kinase